MKQKRFNVFYDGSRTKEGGGGSAPLGGEAVADGASLPHLGSGYVIILLRYCCANDAVCV